MLAVDSYVASHLATIYRKEKVVLARYLFYILSEFDVSSLVPDESYPSLTLPVIANIFIPIPPLHVQREIVRILDKFTELETELEAKLETELELRKQQYAYYRDQLLAFER